MEVMDRAISAPAADVKGHAPKIVSFEIPLDKIGEVIGPKGKVINTIQQETGADIAVDDDGTVGRVTIGAKEALIVDEARRRIELILDPPTAEVGAVYPGKVVNITKFGAFVNILPGRDGLLHISRLGQGKRIDRVEDVLELGQSVDVTVDDIDPQGKISLSMVGSEAPARTASADAAPERRPANSTPRESTPRESAPAATATETVKKVSFEDEFAVEIERDFGNLGPADIKAPQSGDDRGPRRRGGPRR
jgi:polyribonucleotide nucleotidyltransferase